jgi:hypothetical protein
MILKQACIYVSFNDTTLLEEWEQEDLLQALFRRIAFAATLLPNEYHGGEQFA